MPVVTHILQTLLRMTAFLLVGDRTTRSRSTLLVRSNPTYHLCSIDGICADAIPCDSHSIEPLEFYVRGWAAQFRILHFHTFCIILLMEKHRSSRRNTALRCSYY